MFLKPPNTCILCLFLISLISCQKEEADQQEYLRSVLMDTGWKLEEYRFHFNDQDGDLELDSLVLRILKSDSSDDSKVVYTDRWIVYDSDSTARTAFHYDLYSRPKDESDWIPRQTSLTGEAKTEWGFDLDEKPYLNIYGTRPILIELVNENCFILKDAYVIESTQTLNFNSGTMTFIFGDYPAGTLKSIDAVYKSAAGSEGPPWFPPWPFWYTGMY